MEEGIKKTMSLTGISQNRGEKGIVWRVDSYDTHHKLSRYTDTQISNVILKMSVVQNWPLMCFFQISKKPATHLLLPCEASLFTLYVFARLHSWCIKISNTTDLRVA